MGGLPVASGIRTSPLVGESGELAQDSSEVTEARTG